MLANLADQDLPPLHRASYDADIPQIVNLLSSGADVDERFDVSEHFAYLQQLTPLTIAAGSTVGSLAVVIMLLKAGADPLARSASGAPILWYAAGSEDSTRVAAILNAGANASEILPGGRTALREAASVDDAQSVQLLLAAGASPEPFGEAPPESTYMPAVPRIASVVESMKKFYTASWPPHLIPLFCAASSGGARSIPLLVAAGADPNFLDRTNSSALMDAASPEAVDALIAAGARIELRDNFDHSALDRALDNSLLDVSAVLIRAGSNIEDQDSHGRTALLKLCSGFGVEAATVRFLIEAGANVHAVAKGHGWGFGSALHIAARLGSWDRHGKLGDVIRLLVDAGLPVDTTDERGDTALDVAVDEDGVDLSAVAALLELGADPNSALWTAVDHATNPDAPEAIRLMLSHGGDPNLKTKNGFCLRDFAAKRVAMWEGIVADPPEVSAWTPPDYDPAASHRRALESAREILQVLKS